VLLARLAPAGLPNPATQSLDLAIQREQNDAGEKQKASNTSQRDQQIIFDQNSVFKPSHFLGGRA
jgi:hypothetical protein